MAYDYVWNDLGDLDLERGPDWEDDQEWSGWNYTTQRSLANEDWANSGWNNSSSGRPNFIAARRTPIGQYDGVYQVTGPSYSRQTRLSPRYSTPTRQATYMAGQSYLPGNYDLRTQPYNLTQGSLDQTPDYTGIRYY